MDVGRFRRRILAWYDANKRDLPWRGSRDAYAIWVSEIMLQQTRVDVVTPYYARWMRRFPTVDALAAASEETVLELWAGLGYYSRARSLHRAARMLGGRLPTDRTGWEALPGIGPYTSAAIASIAHGERAAAIDGNIERVAARILAVTRPRAPEGRKAIAAGAAEWLSPARPGDWNQALMDLGATVCTPTAPRCGVCPVAGLCKAKAIGREQTIPERKRNTAVHIERPRFVVLQKARKILLVRRENGLLAGMWLLPGGTVDPEDTLQAVVKRQTGLNIDVGPVVARARHKFSHRTWEMDLRRVAAWTGRPKAGTKWVDPGSIRAAAVPAAVLVLLASAGMLPPSGTGASKGPPRGMPAASGKAGNGAGDGAWAMPSRGRSAARRSKTKVVSLPSK